jgi:hypothetical protein
LRGDLQCLLAVGGAVRIGCVLNALLGVGDMEVCDEISGS